MLGVLAGKRPCDVTFCVVYVTFFVSSLRVVGPFDSASLRSGRTEWGGLRGGARDLCRACRRWVAGEVVADRVRSYRGRGAG